MKIQDIFDYQSRDIYVVAEIGINANGDLDTALRLIREAKAAGCDAVKFQKRHLESLYPKELLDDPNSQEWGLSYLISVLKKCEHPEAHYLEFRKLCDELEIDLIVTPFDIVSAEFVATLKPTAWKIASADFTNENLIKRCHELLPETPFLMSTGMWDEETIFERAEEYRNNNKLRFCLLLANSSYPTPYEQINLRFFHKLQTAHPFIGYSGHELGTFIPIAACALGARVVEKHITLDKNADGPDHKASMYSSEFFEMVRNLRNLSLSLGGKKEVSQAETLAKQAFAKSATATRNIKAGEVLSMGMIGWMSPGKGIFPHEIQKYIGRPLKADVSAHKFITEYDFQDTIPFRDWNIEGMGFKHPVGVKTRFHDFDNYIQTKPKVIEFHASTEDILNVDFKGADPNTQLVIHAPEFEGEMLIDFCSDNPKVINRSVELIQKTIDKTININRQFPAHTAKVVLHVGGIERKKLDDPPYDKYLERAMDSFSRLRNLQYVEFLPETMPVRANFYGGEHFVYGFTRAEDIIEFCQYFDLGLCFDTSHSFLACNDLGGSLYDFTRAVKPYVRHLHLGDGKGIHGEGLQIGQGDIDFKQVFDILSDVSYSAVSEVWSAHLNGGREFLRSFHELQKWKGSL